MFKKILQLDLFFLSLSTLKTISEELLVKRNDGLVRKASRVNRLRSRHRFMVQVIYVPEEEYNLRYCIFVQFDINSVLWCLYNQALLLRNSIAMVYLQII